MGVWGFRLTESVSGLRLWVQDLGVKGWNYEPLLWGFWEACSRGTRLELWVPTVDGVQSLRIKIQGLGVKGWSYGPPSYKLKRHF